MVRIKIRVRVRVRIRVRVKVRVMFQFALDYVISPPYIVLDVSVVVSTRIFPSLQ